MKKYFDLHFFKTAIIISLPIIIQQLVTALAQLVDNVMVGMINGQAIAGVGAVNSIMFVLMTLSFGVGEGASIFIAQQYGAKKYEKIGNSLAISLAIILVVSVTTLTFINSHDNQLLRLYIHGDDISSLAALNYGLEYLNILVWGYWLLMINAVIGSSFRAIGKTKVPMLAGIVTVITNTCLNFILIPKYGVSGAAIATISSRIIEFSILFIILKFVQTEFEFNIKSFLTIQFNQFKQMILKIIPLAANEFMWGFGTATLIALYGARSITDLASIQIAYTIADILFVSMSGFGVAVAVLIGQKLGQSKFSEAKLNSLKLILLSFICGIGFLLLAQVLALFIPVFYPNVDAITLIQSSNLLRIIGIAFPIYMITVTFFFTLRAGGDTVGVLIMDSFAMWMLAIPTAYLLVHYTQVSIYVVFLAVTVTDVIKMFIGFYRYHKDNWLNNIA